MAILYPADDLLEANLATLKLYVGARTNQDDSLLQQRLWVATSWVYDRIKLASRPHADVQEAILLLASRLYARRQSPQGAAGFGGEGVVIRITANDSDIAALLARHLDYSRTDDPTVVRGQGIA